VPVRRKVFVSYFRADRAEVEEFVDSWVERQRVFIPQIIGAFGRGIINSTNTEYVIGRIRTEHIAEATVTMVLVGSCTHSRRHVTRVQISCLTPFPALRTLGIAQL
jgi:hypothetical protein